MTAESHFCSQLYMYLISQHVFDYLCTLEADSIHARGARYSKKWLFSVSQDPREALLSTTKFMFKKDVQMHLVVEACGVTLNQVPSVDDVDL